MVTSAYSTLLAISDTQHIHVYVYTCTSTMTYNVRTCTHSHAIITSVIVLCKNLKKHLTVELNTILPACAH